MLLLNYVFYHVDEEIKLQCTPFLSSTLVLHILVHISIQQLTVKKQKHLAFLLVVVYIQGLDPLSPNPGDPHDVCI